MTLEEIIEQVNPNRLAPTEPLFATIDLDRLKRQLGIDDPSPETRAIAENLKGLIPDGATIQVGVGTPSSYMPRLGVFDDKVDLGLHSELTVPGVAQLVGAGVINGSLKTLHRGSRCRDVVDRWKRRRPRNHRRQPTLRAVLASLRPESDGDCAEPHAGGNQQRPVGGPEGADSV